MYTLQGGYEQLLREGCLILLCDALNEMPRRAADGRFFPYSGDFDPLRGNLRETSIGMTSAVGIFPSGESPCGALDMSGNTWEWCENHFIAPDTQDLSGTDVRSLSQSYACSTLPLRWRTSMALSSSHRKQVDY
jgi:formylglycine-generating enzyme required for sulfatase activity